MKKLLFLALLPFMFSCGGDDDDTPPVTNQQTIIGKWSLYEYATSKDYTDFKPATSEETLTFSSGNTYTKTTQNSTTSGKYTVDDVYLTLDGHWTYWLNFDGSDIMYLREYGFGEANNVFKYRRMK